MKTTGTRVAQKATSNAGQGAKAGMTAAPYKPTAKMGSVARPANYAGADIRGVSATSPKKNPMYPSKPSSAADATSKYGTGLVQGKADGRMNNFPDQKRGSGRPVGTSQKGV